MKRRRVAAWTVTLDRSRKETFDSEADHFWRQRYSTAPYARTGFSYEDFRPAFLYGVREASRHQGRSWDELRSSLEEGWEEVRGLSPLTWSEAEKAVQEAWNDARFGSTGDRVWDQIYPAHARPGTLEVPLQELHDPTNGRLDAGRVAESLKVSLKQMAEALGKNYSSVHKTPTAQDLQPFLQSVKTILVILEDVMPDRSAVLAWLNHPHPDLGDRTPLGVILKGYPDAVKNLLQAAMMGIPS